MKKHLNFSEHTLSVFSNMNTDYEQMNNLMQDLALGREIYDSESDRKVSKAEANAKILDFSRQVLGIVDINDAKHVRRAIRDNSRQWFDIIEDTVDKVIEVGLKESDWFNEFIDYKTIGYQDRQDFILEENDAILSVAKAGTSHHDHILQRLSKGEKISITTDLYVVKIGADINKYIVGDVDWDKLVNAIAKAYLVQIQEQAYAQINVAASQLPSQFVGTGNLVKSNFDDIIQAVQAANNGAEVIVLGGKSALGKINAIADVQWAAVGQKESVMNTGNIGVYEGVRLIQLPNRFKDASMQQYMFPTNVLNIIPVIGDEGKFIKVIDEGDTEILEKMNRGDYTSDIQTYEVQRRYGVGCVLGRYFGRWTI